MVVHFCRQQQEKIAGDKAVLAASEATHLLSPAANNLYSIITMLGDGKSNGRHHFQQYVRRSARNIIPSTSFHDAAHRDIKHIAEARD